MQIPDALLCCLVQAQVCALPLARACEVMRPLPMLALESMPSFVAGWSVVRGQPTPVIDLSLLLGLRPERPAGRFVLVRSGVPMPLALAVTDVLGIRYLGKEHWRAEPAFVQAMAPQMLSEVRVANDMLFMVLNSARLLSDELRADLHQSMQRVSQTDHEWPA